MATLTMWSENTVRTDRTTDPRVKHCDLCGNTSFARIADRDRRGKPWNTVACQLCGLVCHEQIPTESELDEYYAKRYRQEYKGENKPCERRVLRAWLKGERVFRALTHGLPPSARIFEIGAGIGCNLKPFQSAGYSVGGIEPHEGFQSYAKNELNVPVEQGSLFDLAPRECCDVVLLIHVIEHFRSPRRALQHIWHLLAPNGLLYLECPSLAMPYANIADHFHFAHIHTFTLLTLLDLARSCGFEVDEMHADGSGCNLKMILRRTEPIYVDFDLNGYQKTVQILSEYHSPWRRWGWSYFLDRTGRIRQYAREFLFGKRKVRSLLNDCRKTSQRIAA